MPLPDGSTCHGTQLFGPWAIEPECFRSMVDAVQGVPMSDFAPEPPAALSGSGQPFVVAEGGIAVIELSGPLTKHSSSFQEMFGGTSMMETRRLIRSAADDPAIKGIMLKVDSPGGTVSGTHDLADDVHAAAQKKPVHAFIEDLGASAAFSIASQATRLSANRAALVGSIGTLMSVVDSSKAKAKNGFEVHVISTGFAKGAGVPGSEITTEQLEDMQRMVDSLFTQFRSDVRRGRAMSDQQISAVATGQVWVAEAAHSLGLVDAVETLDEAFSNLRAAAQGESPMSATIQELRAEFPGEAEFVLDCASKEMSLVEAKGAFAGVQTERLAERDGELAQANLDLELAKAAQSARSGIAPVEEKSSPPVAAAPVQRDWVSEFNSKVEQLVVKGINRAQATSRVARDKELHREYITQFNAERGRHNVRLVQEIPA